MSLLTTNDDRHSRVSVRQAADKMTIRLPDGTRGALKSIALRRRRSMNAEVVLAIEHWIAVAEAEHKSPA